MSKESDFVLDVVKYSIIINSIAGLLTLIGFQGALDIAPDCTEELIKADKTCVPKFEVSQQLTTKEQLDTFGLFRDVMRMIFNNPLGHVLLFLPKMILVLNPTNPALLQLSALFAAIFTLSFFFFILKLLRGGIP